MLKTIVLLACLLFIYLLTYVDTMQVYKKQHLFEILYETLLITFVT